LSIKELQKRRSSTQQKVIEYAFVRSPLVAFEFWRICTDEAQVGVENATLKPALMTSELVSQNQLIVTGTPFAESEQ
jgi:hypothetical protein